MSRKVFFSFHFADDAWRVSQVRNIGVIEGNPPAKDNDWEVVKRGGDAGIQKWIDSQLIGRTCTIVLIGENTANRHWINYEIAKSWNSGLGVIGIHINALKNHNQQTSTQGKNPFDYVVFTGDQKKLSTVIENYKMPFLASSTEAYAYISKNIDQWIEKAILQRKNYGK
jgi:MTH538 TIR-like domain (DUF1863)